MYLDFCIQSVISALNYIDGEIIVIDNNSSDGTKSYIKSKDYKINFLESDGNMGFSKANNKAVKVAKGEYIFFLNPDTIIPEKLFLNFFNSESSFKNMGIVGHRMIDGNGQFLKESKRNSPSLIIALTKILGFNNNYYSNLDEFDLGLVDVLCGANMVIKKTVFNHIYGFNEEYFMFGEDIELSKKSLLSGYNNYYNGEFTLIHFKGESTFKDINYLNNFYGAMMIYFKNIFNPSKFSLLISSYFLKILIIVKSLFLTKSKSKSKDYTKTILISDSLNDNISKQYRNISIMRDIDDSVMDCNIILDPNYLTFQKIIEIVENLKNNKNINYCYLSSDSSYVIESAGMDQKGKVVFL